MSKSTKKLKQHTDLECRRCGMVYCALEWKLPRVPKWKGLASCRYGCGGLYPITHAAGARPTPEQKPCRVCVELKTADPEGYPFVIAMTRSRTGICGHGHVDANYRTLVDTYEAGLSL